MKLRMALLSLLLVLPLAAPGAAQDGGGRGGRGGRGGGYGRGGGSPWERLKQYDTDGDGKVTREEFPGDARIFDRLDADGDGAITEEEASRAGRRGGRDGEADGAGWDRLKAMDTDGDGKVSREEFRGPERVFDRLDADGDGMITEAEVEAARANRPGAEPDWAAIFAKLDRDASGVLDAKDLAKLLEAGDADGDGKLTKEEFVKLMTAKPAAPAPEKKEGEEPTDK